MLLASELREVCSEILNLALKLRFENQPCPGISFYVRELSHRDPKLVKFAIWYLQDKGLMRGFEITHKGVEYVLQSD